MASSSSSSADPLGIQPHFRAARLRSGISLRLATAIDIPAVVALINEAYALEEGDSGVAFKKIGCKRLSEPAGISSTSEPAGWVSDGRVAVAVEDGTGRLVGCIVFSVWSKSYPGFVPDPAVAGQAYPDLFVGFGPFAVAPAAQGAGIGSALLGVVEALATARKLPLQMDIINTRTDVEALYKRRGFFVAGTAPWVLPDVVSRQCHFVVMRKTAHLA